MNILKKKNVFQETTNWRITLRILTKMTFACCGRIGEDIFDKKTLKQGLQGTLANKRHRPRRPLATKLQHTFRLCPCSLFGKLAVIQFGNPILPDGPGNKLLRGQAMWPRS